MGRRLLEAVGRRRSRLDAMDWFGVPRALREEVVEEQEGAVVAVGVLPLLVPALQVGRRRLRGPLLAEVLPLQRQSSSGRKKDRPGYVDGKRGTLRRSAEKARLPKSRREARNEEMACVAHALLFQ